MIKTKLNVMIAVCALSATASAAEPEIAMPVAEQGVVRSSQGDAVPQSAPQTKESASLDEVVVTATRTNQLAREVPASVNVITSKTIENSPATTVDQLLQGIPGVYAARMDSSSPNRIAQTYTRGLPGSGRTLVLMDGVPMNSMFDGQVDWSQLSTKDVERVEIVRGASSGLYGNNAMGGVINIISKQPKLGLKAKAEGEYGTNDTRRFSGSLSTASSTTGLSLSANRLTSDGYNMWTDASKAAAGANASKLIAMGTEKTNASARLTRTFGEQVKADLNFSYLDDLSTGFYAINGYTPQERKQYVASLGLKHFTETVESSLQLFGRFGKQEADTANATYTAVASHASYDDRSQGIKFQSSYSIGKSNQLTVGGDWLDGSIDVVDDKFLATPTRVLNRKGEQTRYGFFVQDEIRVGSTLKINVAGRFDKWLTHGSQADTLAGQPTGTYPERSGTEFSPKAGVLYSVTDKINVRGTAGKAFKLAELTEMYSSNKRGTITYWGNPNLRPETVNSYDLGLDYYYSVNGYVKATVYRNDAKDFVYAVMRNATNSDKVNIEKVVTQGVELEGRAKLHEKLALIGSYTYNESTIKECALDAALVGKQLVTVPKQQAQARVELTLPLQTTLEFTVNYVGERQSNDKNSTPPYAAYTTYDASIAKKFGSSVRATLAVVNIGDKIYQGIGYMAPGRLITAGVGAEF
ncbi:MAG: TonB-dependent receptor [Desulfuromonadaceae bacterium]